MLIDRWQELCNRIRLNGSGSFEYLRSAYSSPDRAYHSLDHIEDCLSKLDENIEFAANPVALELAIWFHDFVYDTRAADNEERSAEAAVEFLKETSFANEVADLIKATKHDTFIGSPDAALLCDIDLSILGRNPDAYSEYASSIRREYSWVTAEDYRRGRIRFLEGFLNRPQIFQIPGFRLRYEEQARKNVSDEIRQLTEEG